MASRAAQKILEFTDFVDPDVSTTRTRNDTEAPTDRVAYLMEWRERAGYPASTGDTGGPSRC